MATVMSGSACCGSVDVHLACSAELREVSEAAIAARELHAGQLRKGGLWRGAIRP